MAADHSRKDIAELLIEKGANVDTQTSYGVTPLGEVSLGSRRLDGVTVSRREDMAALLVAKGAVPDPRSAAALGMTKELRKFLSTRTHVNAKGYSKRTLLHWAGSKEVAQLLIDSGADVNAGAWDRSTPLHEAAARGRADVVRLLIANGANVNARNRIGWTPMDEAMREGRKAIVELLIANGADVNVNGSVGRTALHSAARSP